MQIARLTTLDDAQLGKAIGRAFDDLPSANTERLAQIRDRLPARSDSQPMRLPRLPFFGLFILAGAAAAWLGMTIPGGRPEPVEPAPASAPAMAEPALPRSSDDKAAEQQPEQVVDPEQASKQVRTNNGQAIIYREEVTR
jgi:hypothetical protein